MLMDKLKQNEVIVCIVGLGYVGLPLAIEFSKSLKVIGFDIYDEKIKALNNTNPHPNILFTNDPKEIGKADFVIIAVPTPVTKFQYPDHLFFFSERNLKELLGRTGFEYIKIYRYSILPQLVISKMLKKLIDFIRATREIKNIDKHSITEVRSSNISNSNISGFSFKQLIKNAYSYFIYLIRYKIGYVMPKKDDHKQLLLLPVRRIDMLEVTNSCPTVGKRTSSFVFREGYAT